VTGGVPPASFWELFRQIYAEVIGCLPLSGRQDHIHFDASRVAKGAVVQGDGREVGEPIIAPRLDEPVRVAREVGDGEGPSEGGSFRNFVDSASHGNRLS